MDEVAGSIQKPIFGVGEIASNLSHPCSVGLRNNPGDLDSAGFEVDDEEHEIPDQSGPREHLDAEEVRCCDGPPMSLQEGLP